MIMLEFDTIQIYAIILLYKVFLKSVRRKIKRMKNINYIRNTCVVGDDLFFIINENDSLYCLNLTAEKTICKVCSLLVPGGQWTLYKDKNMLYCISLIDAQVIRFDCLTGRQELLIKLHNSKPFLDAYLVDDKIYFIPWDIKDKFSVFSIFKRELKEELIPCDYNSLTEIYRWSYYQKQLLVTLHDSPYFYDIDLTKAKVKKVYSTFFSEISDVCRDEANYYITSEKKGRMIEKMDIYAESSVSFGMDGSKGYRKMLLAGDVLFLDVDSAMDCFLPNGRIISLPMVFNAKHRGSNFFGVVKNADGWIFVPWLCSEFVFLSDDMDTYSRMKLQLPSDEYIRNGKQIFESDFKLADFIEGVVACE